MNRTLSILFLATSFLGFSKGRELLPSVWIIKDSISEKIHPDSVQLVFNVDDLYNQLMLNQHAAIVQVKIDGKSKKYTITDKHPIFRFPLAKGKHRLAFYINANFNEIYLEREFMGKHHYEIGLNFQGSSNSGRQILVEKPVIYLYSEKEEAFHLKVKTSAALQFTYPAYSNEWVGTSSPNGTIQLNGTKYPYLFWDAQLPVNQVNLDWNFADQLEGSHVMAYLENQLDKIGFNEKEKADFITYWGPRMQKMKHLQVLWMQNKSIDPIASLEISPNFKQNRIYLVFRETSQWNEQTPEIRISSPEPMDRSGNYLVEWGGMEIEPNL